ncbi:hypothetical protein FISHEDRAFT_52312 [Fistulina hepatica ATCC 64428]|nr:hypothetical protein FISHEDRAFT_52312 [Fistulina hepatica ATCC 64428]
MFSWLSWKSSEDSGPSREGRQKCWEARDAYFACLDNLHVLKAGDEGKACATQNAGYHKSCAKSWIEYFNQRRIIAEQQKDRLVQAQNQARSARRP